MPKAELSTLPEPELSTLLRQPAHPPQQPPPGDGKLKLISVPECRNWQTNRTQNPAHFTGRVGSSPTSGTIPLWSNLPAIRWFFVMAFSQAFPLRRAPRCTAPRSPLAPRSQVLTLPLLLRRFLCASAPPRQNHRSEERRVGKASR